MKHICSQTWKIQLFPSTANEDHLLFARMCFSAADLTSYKMRRRSKKNVWAGALNGGANADSFSLPLFPVLSPFPPISSPHLPPPTSPPPFPCLAPSLFPFSPSLGRSKASFQTPQSHWWSGRISFKHNQFIANPECSIQDPGPEETMICLGL